MSKSNKELAVDIALKVIEGKLLSYYDPNRPTNPDKSYEASSPTDITCHIIKEVCKTLEEIDEKHEKKASEKISNFLNG